MKKVLLTAMTLVSIATSSVFGYYGANADWVDFLTDGNQFRARVRQIGFVLGNSQIKGVFGFRDENGAAGNIFSPAFIGEDVANGGKSFLNFMPTVSAGIGYTSEAFGIGLGYNYQYKHNVLRDTSDDKAVGLSVHTPVVTMNFLNNNLRIALPVSVAVKSGEYQGKKADYTGVSVDSQIQYYPGMEIFSKVELHFRYGMNEFAQYSVKESVSSFGFEGKIYVGGSQLGDVKISPFIKVNYNTALDAIDKNVIMSSDPSGDVGYGTSGITAGSGLIASKNGVNPYEINPYTVEILPTLGLSGNSDVVNIYVEAALGYRAREDGYKSSDIEHGLRWNAYGEIYIRPIQDLEWYFEAEIGNGDVYLGQGKSDIMFNNSTGITWYLPSFQN